MIPALLNLARYSLTVVFEAPDSLAVSLILSPASCFSCKIFSNLFQLNPLSCHDVLPEVDSTFYEVHAVYSRIFLRQLFRSSGISVRFRPESLSGMKRNGCPVYAGTGVRFAPEYTSTLVRRPIVEIYRPLFYPECAASRGLCGHSKTKIILFSQLFYTRTVTFFFLNNLNGI